MNSAILVDQVLASMQERASTNEMVIRILKILYPNIFDVGCFSHTIDNAGEKISVICKYQEHDQECLPLA